MGDKEYRGSEIAVASSFFQKRESHNITNRGGQHNTSLGLLLARKQQLWNIKDCKVVAGEYVTIQHKPVMFVVRIHDTSVKKLVV